MENNLNYINIYLFDRTVGRMVDRTTDRQMTRQPEGQTDRPDRQIPPRFHFSFVVPQMLDIICK